MLLLEYRIHCSYLVLSESAQTGMKLYSQGYPDVKFRRYDEPLFCESFRDYSEVMPEALQHIITELTPWLQEYGYFLLFVAIAVEGFGIPAPGQSLLIVASLLAATGQMSLPLVLIVAACGALSGNSLGYFIGWRFGDVLLKKGWIKPQLEDKIHSVISQYGIAALVLSRFVEGLKQFMFIGCGLAKMPLKQFIIGNSLATSIWVTLFGLGPVLIRDQIAPILAFYHQHKYPAWAIISLLLAALLVFIWRKWQLKKTQ